MQCLLTWEGQNLFHQKNSINHNHDILKQDIGFVVRFIKSERNCYETNYSLSRHPHFAGTLYLSSQSTTNLHHSKRQTGCKNFG